MGPECELSAAEVAAIVVHFGEIEGTHDFDWRMMQWIKKPDHG